MYFTSGSNRAFESLMQGKPGFDHYDSGDAGAPEDCGDCRFYRPDWKYQFCMYAECPYQPGKLTALDAVLFQVKGVDDEMAVFRVEKNRGYTVMSNHLLSSPEIENILENSDFICLLNQASGDRKILAERLNISPQQLRYVDNSEPGEGLLIYENVILPFKNPIPQNTQLYRIMTTRLGEGATV